MKLAVTYDNGSVMQHFGRTEQFLICEIRDGKLISSEVVDTNGPGHGAIPPFLRAHGIEVVICGGLGAPMMQGLTNGGMKVVNGVTGDAAQAVEDYLAGRLQGNPNAVHTGCHGH